MATLKKGIKILLLILLLFSCKENKGILFLQTSMSSVSKSEYNKVYELINDTINSRSKNGLRDYIIDSGKFELQIDSLLCFDKAKDRFVGCILGKILIKGASMDNLGFLYGEKIGGQWYFFLGASVMIPRSMVKGHDPSKPLSYQQLHEIALKEVYAGYLNEKGEINEEWFKGHFENVGVCSECKTREDFQRSILQGSAAIWSTRDTTKPIIHSDKKQLLP